MNIQEKKTRRKPDWLRIKLPDANEYQHIRQYLSTHKLNTICESGNCPNMGECWGAGTATFMILGDICTRSCRFCAVKTGIPLPPDTEEPENVAKAIEILKLKHCVITSVDRDDLEDGGAQHWAKTIYAIREKNPNTTTETLIPDFQGKEADLDIIIKAFPDIISHNLETVKRLTPEVRRKAIYERSLKVLSYLSQSGMKTKSGIMLGLGEKESEIFETMDDLLESGVKIITLGQYLQPTVNHLAVEEYVHPDIFAKYKEVALEKGFNFAESAPLVRSSYHAEKHVH